MCNQMLLFLLGLRISDDTVDRAGSNPGTTSDDLDTSDGDNGDNSEEEDRDKKPAAKTLPVCPQSSVGSGGRVPS